MSDKFRSFPIFDILKKSELHSYHEYFNLRTYQKEEIIHPDDRICRNLYFIISGLVYASSNSDIIWYEFEGNSFTELEGFYTGILGTTTIRAAEANTELLYISRNRLDELCQRYHQWALWAKEFYLQEFYRIHNYYENLRNKDATERYYNLVDANPEILQRIPLGHIASYLGISQVSLSRIRAGKQRK